MGQRTAVPGCELALEGAELFDVWPHMLRASSNLKNRGKTKRTRPWGGRAEGVRGCLPFLCSAVQSARGKARATASHLEYRMNSIHSAKLALRASSSSSGSKELSPRQRVQTV